MTALFEASRLHVRIGAVTVCRRLDLRIEHGEHWCILGRNGAGKTTLLHTLAGLRPPHGGSLRLAGHPLETLPPRARARAIGILPQDHADAFPASVLETALIGRHPHIGMLGWEGREDLERAREALQATGLADLAARNVATLSGGERRRLGIATLLAQDPGLLLLDEPTNHLDIHHQVAMLDLLAGHGRAGDKAVVMVMHDLNLASRYCNRYLLLFGNGEILQGKADEVLRHGHLERLYGHPLQRLQASHGPVWLPG
jgi:iron complex transport system ATP-binding protein